jgi:predicted metal-dependent hydrolase
VSISKAYLTVRGINVDVVYKDIKNLHIGVYPPLGRVRVAAPTHMDEERIRLAVIQRLAWIKRQRQELQDAARQSARELVNGESHYVWGQRYRLRVVERPGRAHVELDGNRLVLYAPAASDTSTRARVLDAWYREQLRQTIPDLIAHWEQKIGRPVSGWRIRRMKTKWGSCNRESGQIWFNVELAKKHPRCLEYLIVHEMTHLIERGHGPRFTKLMDEFLPDWRQRRDELNDAPLAAEQWAA